MATLEEPLPGERQQSLSEREESRVQEEHSQDIYTVANIITVLRLILVPFFFAVLISGPWEGRTLSSDVVAFIVFAVAASTDWLDGQIARRTGTVTEIGKAIDPLVDRLLIASGVLGLYIVGRLPLWIVLFLLARDAYLLGGAAYLARNRAGRVPVIFLGKLTTALLLIGFSALILNWPLTPGLGVTAAQWLPGMGFEPHGFGIWFVYAGILTSLLTAIIYTRSAAHTLERARRRRAE
jgi:cardiolipin synthase (CMP-forming)